MARFRVRLIMGVVISMAIQPSWIGATEPLHKQIDAAIVAHAGFSESAQRTDDASFLRRIHLDLAGVIPSAEEVREFLTESSPDKRVKRIDKLLDSPQYARRMQYEFDVMLMERRSSTHVKQEHWEEYLRESFSQNKSWLQLTQEILSADGADEQTRPAARFLLGRELNVDTVTRDIGRIFLGRDLQCAQCHDHPAIDEYLQRHYYGLAAFIKRSYLFKDPKTKQTSIGEKAEGEIEFTSVFTSEKEETPPRILDASPIADPPSGDEPYKVKPEKNIRSVPVYSRRLQLGKSLTDDSNPAFRLSIANRLWAKMMGRGIVEPVDMWHAENPPSHPELLELLADSMLQHDYDIRYLLREIALTDTYQRSSRGNTEKVDPAAGEIVDFSVAQLKPLSPEQLAGSMMRATGVAKLQLDSLIAKQEKTKEKELAGDLSWQEKELTKALRASTDAFVKIFGIEGVQNVGFDASVDQALFLRNGKMLQDWVCRKNGLADRLTAMDSGEVAEEFYLSVFSRMPSADEVASVEQLLAESKDRKTDIQQMVWAGLVSAEFRFNH